MLAYANFLEALEIIERWQQKADNTNEELNRLAELFVLLLGRFQEMSTEISDLKIAESLMRRHKNEEILNLKNR